MKKKVLSALLSATLVVSMLAGCGGNDTPAQSSAPESSSAQESSAPSEAVTTEEGSVLNIYCWNNEFRDRVVALYPGYEKIDETHGTIGDVSVVWNETPNKDNAYQNNLDENLLKQADAAADEKIDIFLVEADYALKYVDTDYTMAVADLGITDADIANQYKYTKDVVTDSNGVLKGLSWQGCPGVMFYSREAAKEIFGTDDPATVQENVKDWATFNATAKTVSEKGYSMVASANDTYRTYSNNVTTPWVVDGKITIDDNIMNWVNDSKALVDAGYTGTYDLWSSIGAQASSLKERYSATSDPLGS